MIKALSTAAVLLAASPAAAEVVSRSENAFTLRYQAATTADASEIPVILSEAGWWWDSDHTYSGDAMNITVDVVPGGCWCERLADGRNFDHGRTLSVEPGRIVFDAPFGPLRGKATRSELVVAWIADGRGSAPAWTMTVEGAGVGAMADDVDAVMGAGFRRFLHYLETDEAPPSGG